MKKTRNSLILLLGLALILTACGPDSDPNAGPPPDFTPVIAPSRTPTSIPPTATLAPEETPIPSPTALPSPPLNFPDPEAYFWGEVLSGLQRPVDLQNAGDGSGRLFVIEKVGRIRIIQQEGYQLVDQPFLDITDRVGVSGNEQGLLGLAFHPRYAENGLFFVNYTDLYGNTVIARYKVSEDPNRADPASETHLLYIEQPYGNHNGGVLAFGPDGYLYAGLGDGGSANDPLGNAQTIDTLLGKILRLDVDSGEPYAIPADNPFVDGSGLPEIWAYGLRNPWRFSFDRFTGDLYVADVGQNKWEEITVIPAGSTGKLNLGWDVFEGTHIFEGEPQMNFPYIPPVVEYSHQEGGCSVTGGYVYRGQMREWWGVYFYGDYCTGKVWGLINTDGEWQSQLLFETRVNITSFGVDESGELYIVGDDGRILRLIPR